MQKQSNDELIKLIKQGIDTQENYEKLYNQNRGFIYQVIRGRVHGIYECDDLMQQAYIALVRAVNYYNCEREEKAFLQILKYCIWNELRDLTSDISANMQTKIIKYKRTYDKLYNELGCKPKQYQIMHVMNIGLNQLEEIKKAYRLNNILSLNEPINEDGDVTRLDLYSESHANEVDPFENIENTIDNINLKAVLDEALDKLPERAQEVIKNRYYKNKTMEQCGNEMNVTRERVRQIESSGFRQLRKDYVLRRQLDGYFNEYKHVGVNQFNNTRTSSVEWLAIRREQKAKELLREMGLNNILE